MSCDDAARPNMRASASDFIGSATIDERGVLTLDLIARDHNMLGHGTVIYRPGDPHYDEVLQHVGPIRPGEMKPVRPWPDSPPGR